MNVSSFARRAYYRCVHFLYRGLWEPPIGKLKSAGVAVMRRLFLATKLFLRENMHYRASALTYSSILSLVPMLAVVFAIAKGFGLSEFTEQWIRSNIVAKPEVVDTLVGFVQSYLDHTQGGIFLGFGLLMLLWTLYNLTSSIEVSFNQLWQVEQPRSVFRMLTDYTAVFFLLPIFIVVTSGLTIFIYSTTSEYVPDVMLLRPTALFIVKTLPYVVVCFFFTALFAFMPNTHVHLGSALKAGLITGIAFHLLQIAYVNSQMWLTGYNAIYGSFAALPLFMLMCQISWMITLYGAALCYVDQNLNSFYYGLDDVQMSRFDHDCLCVRLTSIICKRFASSQPPISAKELAEKEKIHLRIVTDILNELVKVGIVMKIADGEGVSSTTYAPASDIHKLTLPYLLETIDRKGNHIRQQHEKEWAAFNLLRKEMIKKSFPEKPLHELP